MDKTTAALFAALALAGCGAAHAEPPRVSTAAIEVASAPKPIEPETAGAEDLTPVAERPRCAMMRAIPAWCRETEAE